MVGNPCWQSFQNVQIHRPHVWAVNLAYHYAPTGDATGYRPNLSYTLFSNLWRSFDEYERMFYE